MNKVIGISTGLAVLLLASAVFGTNRYVDNSLPAGGTHNGAGWATAWRQITDVTGVQAGDTVFISGGPAGSSQTYTSVKSPGYTHWRPAGGAPGNPVVYKVGQDGLHNGTVIFDGTSDTPENFIGYPNYGSSSNVSNVVVSGDAGDGRRHFGVRNYNNPVHGIAVLNFSQNLRISYIDFGTLSGLDGGDISGFEFDHNYVYVTGQEVDHFAALSLIGTTWDRNLIHHNVIYIPTRAGGFGADCLQGCSNGCSIYDNTIIGYMTNYTGGQHQDGWQALGGDYIKMYNNTFYNITNYAVFAEALFGDFNHLWIYNNITVNCGGGVICGQSGGGTDMTFSDVIIANNLVENASQSIALNNITGRPARFINCTVANNIIVNSSSGIDLTGNATTISQDNIVLSAAAGATRFVSYTARDTASDFHLRPTATDLVDQGTAYPSYFTTDQDGVTRPQGSGWDIGPYEYKDTGIRISVFPDTRGHPDPSLDLPNPVQASALRRYLGGHPQLEAYTLTGKAGRQRVATGGIYLIQERNGRQAQKLTVIQ